MTRRQHVRGTTREHLIRAATGLFRRKGISGTGVTEICERAGVTKGVFAYHFPGGKDALVVEVVERNGREVQQILAETSAAGFAASVAALFDGYAELLRTKGTDFGCPVAASVVDMSASTKPVRAAAQEAFDSWKTAVAVRYPVATAGGLDSLIVAALEGAILLARADNDPAPLEKVGQSLAGLLEASGVAGLDRAVGEAASPRRPDPS